MTTPADQQALKDIEAARAAGKDPFGDDEEFAPRTIGGDSGDASTDEPSSDTPAVNPQAVTDEPAEEVAQDSPVQTYQTELPSDYKEQRSALVVEKGAAMKKLMDGDITAEEFAVEDARIGDLLENLTAQRIRAETLQEASVQNVQQYQQREITKLIAATKTEIDYPTTPAAQAQFDMALQGLKLDPINANKDYADLIQQAHKVVCALRGVPTKGEQIAQAVVKANRGGDVNAPVTLRNLPAASTPNANGDMIENLGRLSGQAYEDAYSKLSPSQKRQLLDA